MPAGARKLSSSARRRRGSGPRSRPEPEPNRCRSRTRRRLRGKAWAGSRSRAEYPGRGSPASAVRGAERRLELPVSGRNSSRFLTEREGVGCERRAETGDDGERVRRTAKIPGSHRERGEDDRGVEPVGHRSSKRVRRTSYINPQLRQEEGGSLGSLLTVAAGGHLADRIQGSRQFSHRLNTEFEVD
jgi:hypothetical protein